MAGFMAGFGKGFSRSFEAGNQRIHEKRQDAFRAAYDNWTKKKASYDADEQAWKKNLSAGEAIASRYGAPPGAALKAAEWLAAGYTTKEVDEMVKNTNFSMAATPATPEAGLPEAPSPVDDQMTQSGLATPAEIAQPEAPIEERNPATQDGDLLGGMFGPEGIFKNAGKSEEERAANRVMDTTGVSQEEFAKVNEGFTQPRSPVSALATNTMANPLEEFGLDTGLTDAKVGAAKVAVAEWEKSDDPTAKAKAARFRAMEPMIDAQLAAQDEDDPETALKMNDILKNTDSSIAPISEARGVAFTLAQHGLELDKLVQDHPEILSFTGTTAAGIESAKTEVTNLIDFVFENGGATESSLSMALDEMEEQLIGGGKAPEVASAYRQFVAASFRYSYAAAAALGSSGRDLSDKELAMIKDAILVSNNSGDFSKNLRRFAKERWSSIDADIDALTRGSNPQVAFALKDKDAGPFVKDALLSMDEFYKGGKFNDVVKWMNGEVVETTKNAPNPQQTTQPTVVKEKPTVGTVEIDDDTGDEWQYVGGDPELPESWKLLPNRNMGR